MTGRDSSAVKLTVWLVSGLLGAAAGCETPQAGTVKQIDLARRALNAADYAACDRFTGAIIRRMSNDPAVAEVLYLRGQCRLGAGRRQAARADFDRALVLAGDPELGMWLEVQIANMDFDDALYPQACIHYARAVPDLPNESPTDRILYQFGVALQRSQRFVEARRQFARLLSEFPKSSPAADARRKYAWTENHFSVQCGAFSRLDLAQKAAERLRSRGIDTFLVRERRGGRRYLVLAGRLPTYRQAQEQFQQIRRFQSDAFIVP